MGGDVWYTTGLEFGTTSGGSNFVGAYQLTLMRPDTVESVEFFPMVMFFIIKIYLLSLGIWIKTVRCN